MGGGLDVARPKCERYSVMKEPHDSCRRLEHFMKFEAAYTPWRTYKRSSTALAFQSATFTHTT